MSTSTVILLSSIVPICVMHILVATPKAFQFCFFHFCTLTSLMCTVGANWWMQLQAITMGNIGNLHSLSSGKGTLCDLNLCLKPYPWSFVAEVQAYLKP